MPKACLLSLVDLEKTWEEESKRGSNLYHEEVKKYIVRCLEKVLGYRHVKVAMKSLATNCELWEELELNLLDDGKALTVEFVGDYGDMFAKLGPFTCQEEVKLRVTLVTPYPGRKDWKGVHLALASADMSFKTLDGVFWKF